MQRKFVQTISWPGTLSDATYTYTWMVPSGCSLVHVSATQINATAASTWTLGTDADPNGWITTGVFGASGTPTEFEKGDFDGALVTGDFPHVVDGESIELVITGTAANQAQDGVISLTFVEGG